MNVQDIKKYLLDPLCLNFNTLLVNTITNKDMNLKKLTDDINVFLFQINDLNDVFMKPNYDNDTEIIPLLLPLSDEGEDILNRMSKFLIHSFFTTDIENFNLKSRMDDFVYNFILDFQQDKKRFAFEEIIELFDEKVVEFPSKLMFKYYPQFIKINYKNFENDYHEILMKMINHEDVILRVEADIREYANILAMEEGKDSSFLIEEYLKSFNEHFIASIKVQKLLC